MNKHGMKDPELGGTALRGMLERATADEPLIGPVAANALVAGLKRRRRRRVSGVIGCVVVIAAVSVTVPALTGTRQATPAPAGPTGTATATVYVSNHSSGLVTPISTATNTAGPSIKGGGKLNVAMAATPNGKTVYVLNQASDTVTPISTATNKAGRPIKVAEYPYAITMTPDGKIAYVLSENSQLTAIMTATNTASPPIAISPAGYSVGDGPAITPDGKTVYISPSNQSDYLIPVSTATDKAGKPIRLNGPSDAIAITPDGKTACVLNSTRTRSRRSTPPPTRPDRPSTSDATRMTSRSPPTARPPT